MQRLANITSFSELVDYVRAEYKEAVAYCKDTTTTNLYGSALSLAQEYQGKGASATDGSQGQQAFEQVKSYLDQARSAWYAAGCKKPGASSGGAMTTEPPGDDKDPQFTGAGMGSWSTWLLLGAAVFGAWYLLKKKPAGGKGKKPRKTPRRPRRRR